MKINNAEYPTPAFTFSDVCQLEEWGIDSINMGAKPLSLLAGFVSLAVGGKTLEDGKKVIDAHLASGGKLNDLTKEMNNAVESSGFFKAAEEEAART